MQTIDTPIRKPPHWVRKLQTRFQHGDWLWRTLTILMGLLVLALILGIGYMLWYDSLDAQSQLGIKFFLPSADSSWDPVNGIFQAWPFIYGTVLTSDCPVGLARLRRREESRSADWRIEGQVPAPPRGGREPANPGMGGGEGQKAD